MKKRIIDIFLITVLVYLCVVVALYILQRKMIFYPDRTSPDITIANHLDFAELKVKTTDGLSIAGWWHKAKTDQPTLILFHGNAGHHGHRSYNVQDYIEAGYGIVLASYRGYGGNEGKPSEGGFYQDAHAYITHLINNNVSERDIIIYGQSIGSGVAVQMATKFKNVKALILEAPYTSLPDIAEKQYFFIPVRLLMKDKFDNLSKIKKVKAPLLIMHGSEDKIIPASMGQELYKAANDPKEIYIFDGYGHNDLPIELMTKKVIDFIDTNKF